MIEIGKLIIPKLKISGWTKIITINNWIISLDILMNADKLNLSKLNSKLAKGMAQICKKDDKINIEKTSEAGKYWDPKTVLIICLLNKHKNIITGKIQLKIILL